jgi:hypothetical protein
LIEALTLAALVAAATPVEERYGLPAGLLVAVVMVESSGRNIISARRKCGGRDYGYGQIHDHDPSKRRLALLLTLSTNLDRAGQLLARSRDRCRAHPRWAACRRSPFGLYNANSRTWAGRVHRAWRRLLGAGRGLTS